ncbi:MAG TPA: lasso peptide biosynthesis B2 protein [Allosphingosinicella sp.]|nr:lasso peptide biosynthesis B2 protein [Allosphingosinicella sp.]
MAAFRLPRLHRLTGADWLLLAEALPTLAWASLAIAFLPFRRVAAAASLPRRENARREGPAPRKIAWAVDAWARRVPWRAVCFQRGLAVHRMLRRRGYASVLHYGVAQDAPKGLSAHVWISLDGQAVIGGEEAHKFACLAVFPPEKNSITKT